ncbi:hypothetical protein GQ44DRAFT_762435 [Phaeosphaeriaceae sp. PMI808]|nr:hypothetical protein GQ44DRAFT_762435 [Phaeosphaeriaceae sp. PMI808]
MATQKWYQCQLAGLSNEAHIQASSPTSNERILGGFWDQHHLSTASIRYVQSTLPTPWPILLGCSIRALRNGLLGACMALKHHEGRFRPPSAVSVLLLSTLPYAFERRTPRISQVLAAAGSLLALITLSIMVSIRINHTNDYYGKWKINFSPTAAGFPNVGQCPFVVSNEYDPRFVCPHPYYVGCGLDRIFRGYRPGIDPLLRQSYIEAQSPNTYHVRNKLALGETILGLILLIPGIGGGFFVLIPSGLHPFRVDELDTNDKSHRWKRTTARIAVPSILVIIAVSFPPTTSNRQSPPASLFWTALGRSSPRAIKQSPGGRTMGSLYSIPGLETRQTERAGLISTTLSRRLIDGAFWSIGGLRTKVMFRIGCRSCRGVKEQAIDALDQEYCTSHCWIKGRSIEYFDDYSALRWWTFDDCFGIHLRPAMYYELSY